MQGGGKEPDYLPGVDQSLALIVAREDFPASALHEAAHWCVASRRQRALPDYGYSYVPPPRSSAEQAAFFAAELRVQSVEWYLARRAGIAFRASADDPELPLQELECFQDRLRLQVDCWERDTNDTSPAAVAPPPRAVIFGRALRQLAGPGLAFQ